MRGEVLVSYLAAAYSLYGLAIGSTLLRLYSRTRAFRQLGADDILIIVAILLGAAILGLEHVMTAEFRAFLNGNGDAPSINPKNPALPRLTEGLKFQYIGSNIYMAEVGFIKLSLLAFYRRFLPPKPYHMILYVLGIITILFVTATTLAGIFACQPIAGAWDPTLPGIRCPVEVFDTHFSNAVFNVITDFIILALPIPTVVRLHADFKKRIALVILFSVGLVATVITIVRMVRMIQIRRVPPERVPTWLPMVMNTIMWSEIEIAILIMCANLPGIYALWRRPKPTSSNRTPGSYGDAKSPARGLHYDSIGGSKKEASAAASSAFGNRTTTTSSSEEHIVSQPDEIHLSTRVVVNVE